MTLRFLFLFVVLSCPAIAQSKEAGLALLPSAHVAPPRQAVQNAALRDLTANQTAARPPAIDVARAVQKRYDTIRDFSADFVHTYVGGVLGQQVTERGKVVIKKPGKMRWTYTNPEKKEFVSDGSKVYSYVPQDRQVTINAMPSADEASTPTLFLAGKGNLTRDFTVTYTDVPDAPPDTWALKLVPVHRQQDYDWLILVVDRRTYQIRMLVTTDTQGGKSTFTFTNMKENLNVPDKEFAFRIPRGVEVVDNTR